MRPPLKIGSEPAAAGPGRLRRLVRTSTASSCARAAAAGRLIAAETTKKLLVLFLLLLHRAEELLQGGAVVTSLTRTSAAAAAASTATVGIATAATAAPHGRLCGVMAGQKVRGRRDAQERACSAALPAAATMPRWLTRPLRRSCTPTGHAAMGAGQRRGRWPRTDGHPRRPVARTEQQMARPREGGRAGGHREAPR